MAQQPKKDGAKPKKRKGLRRRIGGSGPWWVRTIRWIFALALLGAALVTAGLAAAYALVDLPKANADYKTQTTTIYYSDGKTKIGTLFNQDRVVVKSNEISPNMKAAIIAAEDRTFYTNKGVSVTGMLRALKENTTSGEITSGGSTITQQYVKVLYLNQQRTYSRKAKEAILSLKIDRKFSKEEILTNYLNTIYYGNGSYGVQVAAKNYFGVSAKDVGVAQAAFLATAVNSPTYYNPYAEGASERILPRYQYVLDGMLKDGSISQEQHDKVYNQLPAFKKQSGSNRYAGTKGYLLAMVEDQMVNRLKYSSAEVSGGGLKIVTTFNKDMQADAVSAVESQGPVARGYKEANSAVVSVQPGNGAVRAMYGGPNYLKKPYNWALNGTQTGSTFKAFGVIAALEDGYSLNTRLNGSSPYYLSGESRPIKNQGDGGGSSHPSTTLKQATADSINTAFIDLEKQMGDGDVSEGVSKVLDAAAEAGIPAEDIKAMRKQSVPVTVLGYYPIAPVDMANAYATIVAGGKRTDWYVINRVYDSSKQKIYQHEVTTQRVFSSDVAADTLQALQAVMGAGGTGVNGRTVCPTAGKTGTATGGEDGLHVSSSWFMGLVPSMATAVMNNRGDGNDALDGYFGTFYGGQYPALTFRDYADRWLDTSRCGTFLPAANLKATKGKTGSYSTATPSATATVTAGEDKKNNKTPTPEVPRTSSTAPAPAPTTQAPTTEAPAPTTAAPTTEAPAPTSAAPTVG